jgi:uncharacterized 2Fe-2S/4Fe-4S cluster protein (DUF4445 family)
MPLTCPGPLRGLLHFAREAEEARHLDLDAARRIGLVPDLPDDRITQVGNASLAGASTALLSATRRRVLENLVGGIEHVELETDPGFFDHFVEGCQFTPLRLG